MDYPNNRPYFVTNIETNETLDFIAFGEAYNEYLKIIRQTKPASLKDFDGHIIYQITTNDLIDEGYL